jgi:uncharacterized protein YycO
MFNLVGQLFVEHPNNYKFIMARDGNNSKYKASKLPWAKNKIRAAIIDDNSILYGSRKLIIKKSGAKAQNTIFEHPEDIRPPPFLKCLRAP